MDRGVFTTFTIGISSWKMAQNFLASRSLELQIGVRRKSTSRTPHIVPYSPFDDSPFNDPRPFTIPCSRAAPLKPTGFSPLELPPILP